MAGRTVEANHSDAIHNGEVVKVGEFTRSRRQSMATNEERASKNAFPEHGSEVRQVAWIRGTGTGDLRTWLSNSLTTIDGPLDSRHKLTSLSTSMGTGYWVLLLGTQ